MNKKIYILIPIILILISSFYYFIFIYNKIPDIKFESTKWKQAQLYGMDQTRGQMLNDLLANHNFNQMTKTEIINLLGPQSDSTYFKDWDLRYWLCLDYIDSKWLCFKFNNDKVKEMTILVD